MTTDSKKEYQNGPPTGDDMTLFALETKASVLAQIKVKPGRKRTRKFGIFTTTGIVLFGIGALTGGAFAGGLFPTKGSATITFPAPEFAATEMIVDFTCLGPGDYDVAVLGGADTMHVECDGKNNATGSMEVRITDPAAAHSVVVTTTNSAQYTVNSRFIEKGPTQYPTNASGQTYGSRPPNATNYPDLLQVMGTTADGQPVQGYVRYADVTYPVDLQPAEYQNWATTFRAQYPNGKPTTMFDSGGVNIVGTFTFYL